MQKLWRLTRVGVGGRLTGEAKKVDGFVQDALTMSSLDAFLKIVPC